MRARRRPKKDAPKLHPLESKKATRTIVMPDVNPGKMTRTRNLMKVTARIRVDVWRRYGGVKRAHLSMSEVRSAYAAAGMTNVHFGIPQRIWRQCVESTYDEIQSARAMIVENAHIKAKVYAKFPEKTGSKEADEANTAERKRLFMLLNYGCWTDDPWLHRKMRAAWKALGRKCFKESRARGRLTLDSGAYSIQRSKSGNTFLAVHGFTKDDRIKLPLGQLPDHLLPSKTIQILDEGTHFVLHLGVSLVQISKPAKRLVVDGTFAKKHGETAVDLGRSEVLTDHRGTRYGSAYGELSKEHDSERTRRNAARARLRASRDEHLTRASVAREGLDVDLDKRHAHKAKNITSNNLGTIKKGRREELHRARVRNLIFQAVYEVAKSSSTVYYENLSSTGFGRKRSKEQNRLSASWELSILKEALESVLSRTGAAGKSVNPAYTSQQVYACGHLGARGNGFVYCDLPACPEYRRKYDDDVNGALNVFTRAYDGEIGLYMPYQAVKEILLSRYGGDLSHPDPTRPGFAQVERERMNAFDSQVLSRVA